MSTQQSRTPGRAVRVFAPATIANLGSGFDVLGIAIDRPGDVVVARRISKPGLNFSVQTEHQDVPTDARHNVAAHVARLMLTQLRPRFGIQMTLHKQMPIGSGLGSSAASSVASVVAVNALLDAPLPRRDLLRFAVEGERKASGAPHADNVAPSLLGGVCLIRSYDPLDVISIRVRNTIVWVVVHPHLVVRTHDARRIMPRHLPLKVAVRQWGNVGGLTAGLASGDAALVGKCTEDVVAELARADLVPGFHEVKQAALHAGAHGCTLSGSGPSMFAVASSMRAAMRIGKAMAQAFSRHAKVPCEVYVSRVNMHGARVYTIPQR
jgi:homoserine kinase